MLVPMAVLTAGAVLGGLMMGPLGGLLGLEVPSHSLISMLPALGAVAVGVGLAWWDFGRARAPRRGFVEALGPLHTLFVNKWYVDDFYRATFGRAVHAVSRLLQKTEEKGLDGGFDNAAISTSRLGGLIARLQNGWVQSYIASVILIVALAGFYLGIR